MHALGVSAHCTMCTHTDTHACILSATECKAASVHGCCTGCNITHFPHMPFKRTCYILVMEGVQFFGLVDLPLLDSQVPVD